MRVVLTEQADFEVPDGTGLWLDEAEVLRVTGWEAKPEGLCRQDVCVPLPEDARRNGKVDVAALWHRLGAPVVSEGNIWVLGIAADERNAGLASLEAPDFMLPDLAGEAHRLSELRGRKVFLTTWASW